jgi:hypothetical protein
MLKPFSIWVPHRIGGTETDIEKARTVFASLTKEGKSAQCSTKTKLKRSLAQMLRLKKKYVCLLSLAGKK